MTEIQQPNPNLPDAAPGRGVPECDGPFYPANLPAPCQAGAFHNEVPFQPTNLPMRRPMRCPGRQPFHWPRRSGARCRLNRRTQATRTKPSERRDPKPSRRRGVPERAIAPFCETLPNAEALPGVSPIRPNLASAETLPSVAPICQSLSTAESLPSVTPICRNL